jgi:protease I
MAEEQLSGKRIAALVDDGFEQVELTEPKKAIEDAGATVDIVSPQKRKVKAWQDTKANWGDDFKVDLHLQDARAEDYDGLLLPGGVMNPDRLRINKQAVDFVREFVKCRKPIAAICHGPWTLLEAGGVREREVTSWPSLRTDLENAGATWLDEAVVIDNEIVTSRKPDDIPRFNMAAIEVYALGPIPTEPVAALPPADEVRR